MRMVYLNQHQRQLHQVQLRSIAFLLPDGYSKEVRALGAGAYGVVIWTKGTTSRVNGIGKREPIEVAIKKFRTPLENAQMAKRCYRELRLLQHLQHDNIARILDLYAPASHSSELNEVFLVMEYVGSTLEKHIDDQKKRSLNCKANHVQLDMGRIPRIFRDILSALLYLKAANVLHRDLKPSNLAITGSGKTVLLDFGLARTDDASSEKTAGACTPCYAAPEIVYLRSQGYGHEVHIWSVGCILFELLTWKTLFEDPKKIKDTIILYIQLFGTIDEEFLTTIPADVRTGIQVVQKDLFEKSNSPGFKKIDLNSYFTEHNRVAQLPRDNAALDLIKQCVQFDPSKRITVEAALRHEFVRDNASSGNLPDYSEVTPFVDDGDRSIDDWKCIIFNEIKNFPARPDTPMP